MTDPIADMLTRIRNALTAKHDTVEVPGSNIKRAIATILLDEGYIKGAEFVDDGLSGKIVIDLKYIEGKPVKVLGGLGTAIVSTSKGIMTDRQAKAANVGGEMLCFVW